MGQISSYDLGSTPALLSLAQGWVSVELGALRKDWEGSSGCPCANLGTSAAVVESVAVAEAAAVGLEFAVAVVGFEYLGLLSIAAPIPTCGREGFPHRCRQRSKAPWEAECRPGEILATSSAQYGAGPGANPPDGSFPPLASAGPPQPLRGANSASTHPVRPTETAEQAAGPEEGEHQKAHDRAGAESGPQEVASLDERCSSSNPRRRTAGFEGIREGNNRAVLASCRLDSHRAALYRFAFDWEAPVLITWMRLLSWLVRATERYLVKHAEVEVPVLWIRYLKERS